MNTLNAQPEAVDSTALFAFVVSDKGGCAPCVVVFASDRTDAKKLALKSEWYSESDIEWTELRVRREKSLDPLARKRGRGRLEDTDEDIRIMRSLGWWQYEGSSEACEECGLCVWEGLPESYLDENGICGECHDNFMKTKDIIQTLRQQSEEIAKENHAGWGNTMTLAAEEMERLERENARLREHCRDLANAVYLSEDPACPAMLRFVEEFPDWLDWSNS